MGWAASAGVLLGLSACQTPPRPERTPQIPAEVERLGTVTDEFNESTFALASGSATNAFRLRPERASEPFPASKPVTVSVSEGGLNDALQLIVAPFGIGLVVEGGPRSMERYGQASALTLTGSLGELIERLSQALNFFYSLRGGVLHVSPEERFMLDLPPALAEDNLAGLTNTLRHLGAQDLYLDRLNRTATFRTNRAGLQAVTQYLEHIRRNRAMLIYDVHVYQVDLADGQTTGVQWNRFGLTDTSRSRTGSSGTSGGTGTGGSGTAAGVADIIAPFGSDNRAVTMSSGGSSGYGIGAVIAGPRFNMDVLIDFLRSQGNVRAISQPRIALMSGSKGSLRVGQSTTYVAKIGSTTTGTSFNQTTVETQSVLTGFELTLFGEEHEGTVYTRINLNLADLLKLNRFTALGTDLTLPETSEREVRTTTRARPGDVVLLGGIAAQRDAIDVNNGIGATRRQGAVQRAELVIALRSRIVRFSEDGAAVPPAAPGLPARMVNAAGQPKAAGAALVPSTLAPAPAPALPAPSTGAIR